jgi:hypothetical protein
MSTNRAMLRGFLERDCVHSGFVQQGGEKVNSDARGALQWTFVDALRAGGFCREPAYGLLQGERASCHTQGMETVFFAGWFGLQLCAMYFSYWAKERQLTLKKTYERGSLVDKFLRKGVQGGAVFLATSLPVDTYFDLLFGASCSEVGQDVWRCTDTPVLNGLFQVCGFLSMLSFLTIGARLEQIRVYGPWRFARVVKR